MDNQTLGMHLAWAFLCNGGPTCDAWMAVAQRAKELLDINPVPAQPGQTPSPDSGTPSTPPDLG